MAQASSQDTRPRAFRQRHGWVSCSERTGKKGFAKNGAHAAPLFIQGPRKCGYTTVTKGARVHP